MHCSGVAGVWLSPSDLRRVQTHPLTRRDNRKTLKIEIRRRLRPQKKGNDPGDGESRDGGAARLQNQARWRNPQRVTGRVADPALKPHNTKHRKTNGLNTFFRISGHQYSLANCGLKSGKHRMTCNACHAGQARKLIDSMSRRPGTGHEPVANISWHGLTRGHISCRCEARTTFPRRQVSPENVRLHDA